MSISNISSGSSMMMKGMMGTQRPDPSKMADQLFSKLDTKGQGYVEKGDLQAALDNVSKIENSFSSGNAPSVDDMFSKMDSDGNGKVTKAEMSASFENMAAQLDGPFPRMRLQDAQNGQHGNMPSSPGGGQVSQQSSTDNTSQSSDPADTNGDGKVSIQESMAYTEKQITSEIPNSTSSSKTIDEKVMKQMMQLIHTYGGDKNADEGNSLSAAV